MKNKLNIQSIFISFDGEVNGFHGAGEMCTFIRLKGCNLKCSQCFGIKLGRRIPRITTSSGKNKKLSEETKQKISCSKRGIDFEDFITYSIDETARLRKSLKYKDWRNQVFGRDNWICQNPNCKYCGNKIGTYLHAHHIKSFSEYITLRFNVDNGITYCRNYHLKSNLHKR